MQLTADTVLLGVLWYVAFLFSTSLHEASHALVAHKLGDPTAYEGGQVTLNPLPHVRRELFGTILVPIVSYALAGWMIGWASAPYDPAWAGRFPRRSALMSLAGPVSNLALVLASGLAIRLGVAAGWFYAPQQVRFSQVTAATSDGLAAVATLLSIFFTLNLVLFLFNLIPVPPLDGSGILPLFLPEAVARRYQAAVWGQPALALVGLVLAWKAFDYVFVPVQLTALHFLYPGVSYGL